MQRYPGFDPPEYQNWEPDPAVMGRFLERLEADPERAEILTALDVETHVRLYRALLVTRLHDIGVKRWVKQGVLSKAWLGTGEEAVTVGTVAALDPSVDVVTPMIRNAGACWMMGMPLEDLFRAYLATADSPSRGRDLHVGHPAQGVIQPVSHMGTNVPVMAGAALAFKLAGEKRVSLTWIGDGATKTASCHEGMNFAAVKDLPVVFVIQNNQVALGTRVDQHGAGDLGRWADMYGIPSWSCDGNNVLDVYAAASLAVDRCRGGEGPAVLLAETFRMGGHATHDEQEARRTFPAELFREWGKRDPIGQYEEYLASGWLPRERLDQIEAEATAEVEEAAERALESNALSPNPEWALYAGFSEGGPLVGLEARPIPAEIQGWKGGGAPTQGT